MEVPNIFPKWKKDKKYKAGDRFFHDGKLYKVPEGYVGQNLEYFNSDLFTKISKDKVENMFDKVNDLFDKVQDSFDKPHKVNDLLDKVHKNKDKDKIEEAPVEPTEENPDANQ